MTDALHTGHHATDGALADEFTRALADEISGLLYQARELDRRLRPAADPTRQAIGSLTHEDPLEGLAMVLRGAEHASATLTLNLERARVLANLLLDT